MPEVTKDDRTITKCGACGKTDNAPKLQTAVGTGQIDGHAVYHPHDFEHDGCVYYHMDCPSPHHDTAGETHQTIIDVCKSGVQNDKLFAHVMSIAPNPVSA